MSEAAKQDDLQRHLAGDWRSAHGIWSNIKTYLAAHIPTYVRDFKSISLTADSAWHEVTVAAGATLVFLSFNSTNDQPGEYTYLYTRKKGESSTFEGIARGEEMHGSMIVQDLDSDGKFEYKLVVVSGSYALWQLGYLKVPG